LIKQIKAKTIPVKNDCPEMETENLGITVVTKKVLKGIIPIVIPLNAPETKSTFLPLLHEYFHFSCI